MFAHLFTLKYYESFLHRNLVASATKSNTLSTETSSERAKKVVYTNIITSSVSVELIAI